MYYISMLKALIYQHSRNIRYITKKQKNIKPSVKENPSLFSQLPDGGNYYRVTHQRPWIDSKEDNKICKGVDHFFVWSKQLISNMTHHPKKTGKNVGRNYWESSMSYGFSWTEDVHRPQHECAICQEMLANANMMASKLRKHQKIKHPFREKLGLLQKRTATELKGAGLFVGLCKSV